MKKYISTNISDFLNESNMSNKLVDFDSFPESVQKTLDEYSTYFVPKYDWNSKMDEYSDEDLNLDKVGFNNWLAKNKSDGFKQNIDTLIQKVNEDINLIDAQDKAKAKLDAFEDLIIPTLGDEVLSPALNKYQEYVLMNPNASLEDIERGYQEGQSIFGEDGSIDHTKITMSDIFTGGEINIPAFERFVEKNPEYQGVYNDWKKIHNEHMDLIMKELNAFRNSTTKKEIIELKDFLVQYKTKNNL